VATARAVQQIPTTARCRLNVHRRLDFRRHCAICRAPLALPRCPRRGSPEDHRPGLQPLLQRARRQHLRKGCLFARSAKYSSNPLYAKLDPATGAQAVFLCRVAVGQYCVGNGEMVAPPVRHGLELYDSTVDSLTNPTMYVSYHDAQAYPEYVVHFKQDFGHNYKT